MDGPWRKKLRKYLTYGDTCFYEMFAWVDAFQEVRLSSEEDEFAMLSVLL